MGANISVVLEKVFKSLPQKPNYQRFFTDMFIYLQDLQRNLILGFNWQCNYRIGCNWNANGQQYITHNNFLCTNTASSKTESIICNTGVLQLLP